MIDLFDITKIQFYIMYQIREDILQEISNKPEVLAKLAKVTESKLSTVIRWIRLNHPNLTMYSCLEVIHESTGHSFDQIVSKNRATVS